MNSLRIQVISNLSHRLTGHKLLSSSFLYNRLDIFIPKSNFRFFGLYRCTCFFINFHWLNRRNMPDNAQVRRHLFLIRINLETIGPIFRWSILQFILLTSKFIRFLRSKEVFKLLNKKMIFSLERTNHFFFRIKNDCIFPQKKQSDFFTNKKRLKFLLQGNH